MTQAPRRLDPAEENDAHLVLWIAPDARIVDAGIYSEETPTMMRGMFEDGVRSLSVRTMSGKNNIGFDRAQRALLRSVLTNDTFSFLRTMPTIMRQKSRP